MRSIIKILIIVIMFLIQTLSYSADKKLKVEIIDKIEGINNIIKLICDYKDQLIIYGIFKGEERIISYNVNFKTSKILKSFVDKDKEYPGDIIYINKTKTILLNTFEPGSDIKERIKLIEMDLNGNIQNIIKGALIIKNDAIFKEDYIQFPIFLNQQENENKLVYNILDQYDITTAGLKLINSSKIFEKYYLYPRRVFFYPDSKTIYVLCNKKNKNNGNDGVIYKFDLTNSSLVLIKNIPNLFKGGLSNYSFSPDGKYFVYYQTKNPIRIINISTGAIKDVIKINKNYFVMHTEWSPDGKKLAYIFSNEKSEYILCIYDIIKHQEIASLKVPDYPSMPLVFCWGNNNEIFYLSFSGRREAHYLILCKLIL